MFFPLLGFIWDRAECWDRNALLVRNQSCDHPIIELRLMMMTMMMTLMITMMITMMMMITMVMRMIMKIMLLVGMIMMKIQL